MARLDEGVRANPGRGFGADKKRAQRETEKAQREAPARAARDAKGAARKARARAKEVCETAAQQCERARAAYKASRKRRDDLVALAREYRLIRRAELASERSQRASGAKRRGPGIARVQESDDEVRANIPPELRALWERTKGRLRGSARRSRTEAFLEYAEAHPDEAIEAIDVPDEDELEASARAYYEKRARANPAHLVALGWLTELVLEPSGRTVRIPRGTLLAYDPRAKKLGLVLVYGCRTSKARAPSSAAKEYARTHWGERGAWGISSGEAPDARKGAPVVGALRSITYTTKKGGDFSLTDYIHPFEGILPTLVEGSRGRVQIHGGSYRVTSRGIVG